MDVYDVIQIMKATLTVMSSNVFLYDVVGNYLLSSLGDSEEFKVEARRYFDKCVQYAGHYEEMVDSWTFDQYNYPQLKKLLMDQVTANVHLRQLVYRRKQEARTRPASAHSHTHSWPVAELVQRYPGLLPRQQSGSISLTDLCSVLLEKCNIRKDPVICQILSQVEVTSKWGGNSKSPGRLLNTPYLAEVSVAPQRDPRTPSPTQAATSRPVVSQRTKKLKPASRVTRPDIEQVLFSDPLVLPRPPAKKVGQRPVGGSRAAGCKRRAQSPPRQTIEGVKRAKTLPAQLSTAHEVPVSSEPAKGGDSVTPQKESSSLMVKMTKTSSTWSAKAGKTLAKTFLRTY